MNLSACLPTTGASPDCCAELADMGFRELQLSMSSVSQEAALGDWKQAAEKAGLQIDALFLDPLTRFGMREAPGTQPRKKAEQILHEAADMAHRLGVKRLVIPCRGASAVRNRDDLLYTAHCVRLACAVARRYGLETVLTDLPPEAGASLARSSGYTNIALSLRLAPPYAVPDAIRTREMPTMEAAEAVPVRELRLESSLAGGLPRLSAALDDILNRTNYALVLECPATVRPEAQQQAC